jgi:hypothetical protein
VITDQLTNEKALANQPKKGVVSVVGWLGTPALPGLGRICELLGLFVKVLIISHRVMGK